MSGFRNLIRELRRRRVFRAAGIYIVGAWVAVQVASLAFPAIDVPDSAIRYVWIAVILLFPLALVFSWFYELSPDGIMRTPPLDSDKDVDLSLRRTDALILGAMALVGISIAWQTTSTIQGVPLVVQSGESSPVSIAVLPLENVSGDPEQQFFVSGMYDGLFSSLSRVPELRAITIPSALLNSGTADSIKPLVSQLGVDRFVEGSVERVDDKVTISVQLTDSQQDQHLWQQTFEANIVNVMTMQTEMANAIANEVVGVVAAFASVDQQPINPAAFEAFLRGEFHIERFTPEDIRRARLYYEQALEIDPDFALAHWGLSKQCGYLQASGIISGKEAVDRCLPPAVEALRLDPDLPESQIAYANYMLWILHDFEKAGQAFEKAIELNPSFAEARANYSNQLAMTGHLEESTAQIALARELDPLNPVLQIFHAYQLRFLEDPFGAIEMIEAAKASAPGFNLGSQALWQSYWATGQYDEAMEALITTLRVFSPGTDVSDSLASMYDGSNYSAAVLAAADDLVANLDDHPFNRPTAIGSMYLQGGDIEKAIDWFETAFELHSVDAIYVPSIVTPEVQGHPRFIALLRERTFDYWADEFAARAATN